MHDDHTRIIQENYGKLEKVHDFNSILDECFCNGIVDLDEYESYLSRKKGRSKDDILNLIKPKLLRAKDGYDIFFKIFKRHEYLGELNDYRMNTAFDDAIRIGQIAKLPTHYVERTAPLNKLKNAMSYWDGDYNKILVHGMIGYGKTALASASVRDKELLLIFNNKAYWIKVGKVASDRKILELMYTLYDKILITADKMHNYRALTEMPKSMEIMRNHLLTLLRTDSHKNTLLILDDVYTEDIIGHFDVGCKLLVTSREKISVLAERVKYICVDDGFTLSESLDIFKKSLKRDDITEDMYTELYDIYIDCRGDPLSIKHWARILQKRREAFLNDPAVCIQNLDARKQKSLLNNQRFNELRSWYDTLEQNTKEKYLDLAIFLCESNLYEEVFANLWPDSCVGGILEDLERKNFIMCKYEKACGSYAYGIHHVYHEFLQTLVSPAHLQNTHRKFITAYKNAAHGDYARMKNDNYIYNFFGYHLVQGEMFHEFNVYLNLDFLEASIKAIGPALVQQNITIYKEYIFVNDSDFQEVSNLLMTHGQSLHDQKYTSIYQYALMMPRGSWLYNEACKYAPISRVFFDTESYHYTNCSSYDFKLKTKFRVACFARGRSEFLIGTTTGNVELWRLTNMVKLSSFEGHSSEIVMLIMNSTRTRVLSICADGFLYIWNVSSNRSSGNFDENPPRSPSHNKVHQSFFSDGTVVNNYHYRFAPVDGDRIVTACFANSSDLFALGTKDGMLRIPNSKFEKKFKGSIGATAFTKDDVLLAVTVVDNIYLIDVFMKTLQCKFNVSRGAIMRLYPFSTADRMGLLSVHEDNFSKVSWKQMAMPDCSQSITDLQQQHEQLDAGLKCSTMVDNILITNGRDNTMNIFRFTPDEETCVEKLNYCHNRVVCLDATSVPEDTVLLLSGFEDRVLTVWNVLPQINGDLKKSGSHCGSMIPCIASHWNEQQDIATVATATTNNCIQIRRGQSLVNQTEPMSFGVTRIAFDRSGDVVYFGLVSGAVKSFHVKLNRIDNLFTMDESVNYLECEERCLLLSGTASGQLKIFDCKTRACSELLRRDHGMTVLHSFVSYPVLVTVMDRQTKIIAWRFQATIMDAVMQELFVHETLKHSNTGACSSPSKDLICVLSKEAFEIFKVQTLRLEVKHAKTQILKKDLCCCQFSKDSMRLAIGTRKGDIIIWNVKEKQIGWNLKPHSSPMHSLQFSPHSNLILVSVSDVIAWWKLDSLPNNSNCLGLFTRDAVGAFWDQKETVDAKYLLSLMKLPGHRVVIHTRHSPRNFGKLLAIDNAVEMYVLSVRNSNRAIA